MQSTPDKLRRSCDRYRPRFNFSAASGWMNDPNGTVFWRGRWHMFYQWSPGLLVGGDSRARWGHAVSSDLVHWEDLPVAIAPEDGTYDEKGCWSGTAMVEEDRVVAVYHAHQGGNAIAVADDDLLTNWRKLPSNPMMPFDAEKTYDPCIWKDGGKYLSISGRITGATVGDGRDEGGGGRDIAYLYSSPDLETWTYEGPFYDGGAFTNPGEDCACPDFFGIGERYMLLFLSHNQGAQYYLGRCENERFYPEQHGRMNFTIPTIARLGSCGDLAAPIAWKGPGGRRVMIGWVTEGREWESLKHAGWAGVMCLPRDLSLDDRGDLLIRPVPELQGLRGQSACFESIRLRPGECVDLPGVKGDSVEIRLQLTLDGPGKAGLSVLRSPAGEEETLITIDAAAGAISIDPSRSSLSADVCGLDVQTAPLDVQQGAPVDLDIFIDRSIVEVFADGRQCVTKRVYPSRDDSLGIRLFADGAVASAPVVQVWEMGSIWD